MRKNKKKIKTSPRINKKCAHQFSNGKTAWKIDIGPIFGDEFHCRLCGKIEFDY